MVTASPATGTETPPVPPEVADHVAVSVQLPLATEYRVAALAVEAQASATIIARTDAVIMFFIRITLLL